MMWQSVVDGIILKGRQIVIPKELQKQALDQIDSKHTGIKRTRLLGCKSNYWVGINTDIETNIKTVQHVLNFRRQPKERFIHHEIPSKAWEVFGCTYILCI